MCCLIFSRRGLAYFGVLVQLLVGLLVIPLVTLMASYSVGPSSDGSGRFLLAIISTSDIIFVVLYAIGMCILAGLIFKGIRSESIKLLYLSIASLIIFQLGAGVLIILSWKPKGDEIRENLSKLLCLGLNVFSTLVYLIILIWYTRYLKKIKYSENMDCDDKHSDF